MTTSGIADDVTSNLQSVAFTVASVKTICSSHSGSILALNEAAVPLTTSKIDEAREIFRAAVACAKEVPLSGDNTKCVIDQSMIYDLLLAAGLVSKIIDKESIKDLICRFYKGPISMEEDNYIAFLQKFQAPAYYYGQRLRRNAGRGELRDMSDLILRGCDVNTADGEGLTSLHYACEFNRHKILETLVALAGDELKINAKDKYGWSPLHCAVHHGSEECAKLLLKFGVIINLENGVGKCPLHLAASQNRPSMCEILISAGADLNSQDHHGMTPMHDAAFKGHSKLYQYLLRIDSKIPLDLEIRDKLGYLSADYLGNFQYEFPPDIPQAR